MAVAYQTGTTGGSTTSSSGNSSLVLTIPSVNGQDVGIVSIEFNGAASPSPPAGWTLLVDTTNAQANIEGAVYTHTFAGTAGSASSEVGATATWTFTAHVNSATMDVLRGADEAQVTTVAWAVGTGTTVTSPTITVPANGLVLGVWMGAVTTGAGFTFTKDASLTLGQTRATSITSGANRTIGTAYKSASGSTAGAGCTFSASTARNAAYAIAIGPSSSAQHGTGAASLALSVASTGHSIKHGTGAASLDFAATSTGHSIKHGTAAASLALSATSSGHPVTHGTGAASLALSTSSTGHSVKHGTGAASLALSVTSTGHSIKHGRAGVAAVNAFPNPNAVTGGTAFGTSNTTVLLGSTDFAANGVGSAKVTVGASPTTSTFGYPAVASGDAVDNGHTRYTAAVGDTFDFLFTVKAHASNTAAVNILPKIVGYHWTGTANAASTGGETNGPAILLNPGDTAVVAQRLTVATPPTDPIDGILAIPHIRSGSNIASAPVAGAVIYLDRMMLVRNAGRALATEDYFDGGAGGTWSGTSDASSSSGTLSTQLALTAASTGHVASNVNHGTGAASLALSASATGHSVKHGTGAASIALSASSTGRAVLHGSGAASLALSTTSTGRVLTAHGTGAATLALAATAQGHAILTAHGTGAATLALSTSSTGRRFISPRDIIFIPGEPTSSWSAALPSANLVNASVRPSGWPVGAPTGSPLRATPSPSHWQAQEPRL